MDVNTNKYLKIMDSSQVLLERLQIPLYSKLHSGKTFNNHQLFKLLVLKSCERKDYRNLIEFLKMTNIPEMLGLKRIPHYTTLQKFAARQNLQGLEKFILSSLSLVKKRQKYLGIDATGMSLDCASKHYEMRINRRIKKRDFLKLNIIADLKHLLIAAVKIRKKARHDTKDFVPQWNKIKDLDFDFFFGDKGFDAEYIHKIIYGSGRKSVIFLKNEDLPISRTKGFFRKRTKRKIRYIKKGRRSLIETINSVLKRVYGHSLKARKLHNQKVELLFNIIAYNLQRIMIITEKIFLLIMIFFSKITKSVKNHTLDWYF